MEVFNISEDAPSEDSNKSNDWYEDEDEHDYDEEEAYFNSHAHKETSDLHIASLNCKGMMENTKREQLIQIMEREEIDIMCLQETWINSSSEEMKDKYLFLFSTGVSNKDREQAIKNRGTRPGKGKGKATKGNHVGREYHGVGFVISPKHIKKIRDFNPINGRICSLSLHGKPKGIPIINTHCLTSLKPTEEKEKHFSKLQE